MQAASPLRLPDISEEPRMKCPLTPAFSSRGQGSASTQNYSIVPLQTCMKYIKVLIGCTLRWERQCCPTIDAGITDYVHWCTLCMKHKVSPSAEPMLPRDIHNGLWQEIATDYLTHKGRKNLLVCNLFSRYAFLHKVSTKSAQSLCMHLKELISQCGPSCLIYTLCIQRACTVPTLQ